jgi:hypothetical protein
MLKASACAGLVITTLALAACNQSTAGSMATGAASALDPTGLSGAAIGMAQAESSASGVDFSMIGTRLTDVAAGNTAGPNYLAGFDQQASRIMAQQAAGMAETAGRAAVDGALTGGVGLVTAAPALAMKAATAGMIGGQLASVRAQASADIAKSQAQRAAEQLVPDADRPAEAQAILSILDGSGASSASWQNPQTGSSGKVTIKPMNRKMFGGPDCRSVKRELRSGGTTRTGEMIACRDGGEWYDLF